MLRLSGFLLVGALIVPGMFSHGTAFAQQAPQKTTFTGDMVVWAFSVPADKATDYEAVLAKLKEALMKSERPEAKQQLAGWKVMKNAQAQPDGTVVYLHVIDPVVKDADYSIINIVYDAFKDPADRTAFYELYRGALKGALFMIQGPQTANFAK